MAVAVWQSYYGVEVESIADSVKRNAVMTMIRTTGQTPKQLFRAAHPLPSLTDRRPAPDVVCLFFFVFLQWRVRFYPSAEAYMIGPKCNPDIQKMSEVTPAVEQLLDVTGPAATTSVGSTSVVCLSLVEWWLFWLVASVCCHTVECSLLRVFLFVSVRSLQWRRW